MKSIQIATLIGILSLSTTAVADSSGSQPKCSDKYPQCEGQLGGLNKKFQVCRDARRDVQDLEDSQPQLSASAGEEEIKRQHQYASTTKTRAEQGETDCKNAYEQLRRACGQIERDPTCYNEHGDLKLHGENSLRNARELSGKVYSNGQNEAAMNQQLTTRFGNAPPSPSALGGNGAYRQWDEAGNATNNAAKSKVRGLSGR